MRMPFQNAENEPATMPERIVNEAPPSREAVTISCTCLEWEEVKILVNSGIRKAPMVPQAMIEASFHQSVGSERSPTRRYDIPYEVEIQSTVAIMMRRVRGSSKLNSFKFLYLLSEMALLMK